MPDGFQPLSREELEEAKEAAQADWDANLIARGTHGLIDRTADSALHYLARCAELEREFASCKEYADRHFFRAEAAEAALREQQEGAP